MANTLLLEEAARIINVRDACPALATIKQSGLVTAAQVEALTSLVLDQLVEWAWLEIMHKWESGADYVPRQTIQTWLLGKTLHELMRDSGTADEIIELAQMIALEKSDHGLTVFKTQLGKKLTAHGHRLVHFITNAYVGGSRTICCVVA